MPACPLAFIESPLQPFAKQVSPRFRFGRMVRRGAPAPETAAADIEASELEAAVTASVAVAYHAVRAEAVAVDAICRWRRLINRVFSQALARAHWSNFGHACKLLKYPRPIMRGSR